MLKPGKRGIGFAVGQEPLASLFAAQGCSVLATDLMPEVSDIRWTSTSQHANSLEGTFHPSLIDRLSFEARVRFQPADMTSLSSLEGERADFLWSSCAFEHLGSLRAGLDFVVNAMDLLNPGGVAVHTTEFNISSNTDTLETGPDCIYRKSDLEELDRELRIKRCGLVKLDLEPGSRTEDLDYDSPPYFQEGKPHVKILIGQYVCSSVILIVHKSS